MLPRDVPDGPWQEVTANYIIHKARGYLLICDLFSKYPFLYKVSTKSVQSLCAYLPELISQHGPPSLLSMDNGPPFSSEELTQFLQHHCINHATSSPHFHRSNGFVERHVQTIKTALSTAQDSNRPLEDVLLDLQLTPTATNMPSQ